MRHLLVLVSIVAVALLSSSCDNIIRSVTGLTAGCSVSEISLTSPSGIEVPFRGADPLCVYKPFIASDFSTRDENFQAALLEETFPLRGQPYIIAGVDRGYVIRYRIAVHMSKIEGLSDAVLSVWTSQDGYNLLDEIGSAVIHPGEVKVLSNTGQKEINRNFVSHIVVKAVYEGPVKGGGTSRALVISRVNFFVRIG